MNKKDKLDQISIDFRKQRVDVLNEKASIRESRRSSDFFNDSKHGKALWKSIVVKGVIQTSKIDDYLESIQDKLGDQKGMRALEFIASSVGLDHRKYDNQPSYKFQKALVKKIDDLASDHIY